MTDKPQFDAFEASLRSPRTLRLDGNTVAIRLNGDGSADMVIHHAGMTLAAGFSPEQAAVLSAALAPRKPAPQPTIAEKPAAPAGEPSGGTRPDGYSPRAAAAAGKGAA